MSDNDEASKTEEPTAKRLEDQKKKGNVANSQEVKHAFSLLAMLIIIMSLAPSAMTGMKVTLESFIGEGYNFPMDGRGISAIMEEMAANIATALFLVMGVLIVAAIVSVRVQHEILWAPEKLKPKFEKLNPINGLKQKFKMSTVVEFVKSLFKLILVGTVVTIIVMLHFDEFDLLMQLEPVALMAWIQDVSVQIIGACLALVLIMALADFSFQKYDFMKKQRMTKSEVKDEQRQTDGDPEVKKKIAQLRFQRAAERMMQAVPDATVVVANPTHYAVALKYEQGGEMNAPVCVAKGIDEVALRIRSVAEENDVPVVENVPLARALHATVELDQEVPQEQYKAVAEVIGYVMRMKNARSWLAGSSNDNRTQTAQR